MADESVWIRSASKEGDQLAACFLPAKGMNFISYQKNGLEIVEQSTKSLFEEMLAWERLSVPIFITEIPMRFLP